MDTNILLHGALGRARLAETGKLLSFWSRYVRDP